MSLYQFISLLYYMSRSTHELPLCQTIPQPRARQVHLVLGRILSGLPWECALREFERQSPHMVNKYWLKSRIIIIMPYKIQYSRRLISSNHRRSQKFPSNSLLLSSISCVALHASLHMHYQEENVFFLLRNI